MCKCDFRNWLLLILHVARYLRHGNILRVNSLENVTHVHMFLWANPELLHHAMSLVAWSDSVKVLTVIYRGTPSELRALGLVSDLSLLSAQSTECNETTEFTKQQSVSMPGKSVSNVMNFNYVLIHFLFNTSNLLGQHSYSSYVLCMTDDRKARMRTRLGKPKKVNKKEELKLDLKRISETMAQPEWLYTVGSLIGLG